LNNSIDKKMQDKPGFQAGFAVCEPSIGPVQHLPLAIDVDRIVD